MLEVLTHSNGTSFKTSTLLLEHHAGPCL